MTRRGRISRPRPTWQTTFILGGFLLGFAGSARAVIPSDLPLVWRPPTGARSAGLAGAYAAIADDAEALLQNPAALAKVRKTEIGGTVEWRTPKQKITYLGQTQTSDLKKTRIHALDFAYPFPVYRGSIAVGLAYDRAIPLDSKYVRSGAGGSVLQEEESILEDGGVGAWTAGLAMDVTPTLSLGASGTILTGSSQRDRSFAYQQAGGSDREATTSSTSMDLTAVTGTLGALLRPSPAIRAGIVLHLPETFTLKGRINEDTRRYEVAGDTLDYIDSYAFEDKVKLPLRVSAGVALAPGGSLTGLTLVGQADLADWTQIDYAGPILTADRQYAYRSVTDLRVGLEYARESTILSGTPLPLRLRVGFASLPVPYRMVATDVFRGQASVAHYDSDRRMIAAGFGLGLDPSTMLDVGWTRTSFERSAGTSDGRITREKIGENAVLAGITFRI